MDNTDTEGRHNGSTSSFKLNSLSDILLTEDNTQNFDEVDDFDVKNSMGDSAHILKVPFIDKTKNELKLSTNLSSKENIGFLVEKLAVEQKRVPSEISLKTGLLKIRSESHNIIGNKVLNRLTKSGSNLNLSHANQKQSDGLVSRVWKEFRVELKGTKLYIYNAPPGTVDLIDGKSVSRNTIIINNKNLLDTSDKGLELNPALLDSETQMLLYSESFIPGSNNCAPQMSLSLMSNYHYGDIFVEVDFDTMEENQVVSLLLFDEILVVLIKIRIPKDKMFSTEKLDAEKYKSESQRLKKGMTLEYLVVDAKDNSNVVSKLRFECSFSYKHVELINTDQESMACLELLFVNGKRRIFKARNIAAREKWMAKFNLLKNIHNPSPEISLVHKRIRKFWATTEHPELIFKDGLISGTPEALIHEYIFRNSKAENFDYLAAILIGLKSPFEQDFLRFLSVGMDSPDSEIIKKRTLAFLQSIKNPLYESFLKEAYQMIQMPYSEDSQTKFHTRRTGILEDIVFPEIESITTNAFLEFPPIEFAKQLFVFHYALMKMGSESSLFDIFCSIKLGQKNDENSWNQFFYLPDIEEKDIFFTLHPLCNLIHSHIVLSSHSSPKIRSELLRKWILVGESCWDLGDVYGWFCISSAILNKSLTRLRDSWSGFTQNEQDIIDRWIPRQPVGGKIPFFGRILYSASEEFGKMEPIIELSKYQHFCRKLENYSIPQVDVIYGSSPCVQSCLQSLYSDPRNTILSVYDDCSWVAEISETKFYQSLICERPLHYNGINIRSSLSGIMHVDLSENLGLLFLVGVGFKTIKHSRVGFELESNNEMVFLKDTIIAASLESLIDYLLNLEAQKRKIPNFMEIFFTSFRSFCSTDTLFEGLKSRYLSGNFENLKIELLFDYWVTNHSEDFLDNLVLQDKCLKFAKFLKNEHLSKIFRFPIKFLPSSMKEFGKFVDFVDLPLNKLHESLNVVVYNMYMHITRKDLTVLLEIFSNADFFVSRHSWKQHAKPDDDYIRVWDSLMLFSHLYVPTFDYVKIYAQDSLNTVIPILSLLPQSLKILQAFHENMRYFIIKAIVSANSISARAARIIHFVDLAVLTMYSNGVVFRAILGALCSPELRCFTKAWSMIDQERLDRFEKCFSAVPTNYFSIIDILMDFFEVVIRAPEKYILNDGQLLLSREKGVSASSGLPLINFEKKKQVFNMMESLLNISEIPKKSEWDLSFLMTPNYYPYSFDLDSAIDISAKENEGKKHKFKFFSKLLDEEKICRIKREKTLKKIVKYQDKTNVDDSKLKKQISHEGKFFKSDSNILELAQAEPNKSNSLGNLQQIPTDNSKAVKIVSLVNSTIKVFKQKHHQLQVVTEDNQEIFLQAENKEEMNSWLQQLNMAQRTGMIRLQSGMDLESKSNWGRMASVVYETTHLLSRSDKKLKGDNKGYFGMELEKLLLREQVEKTSRSVERKSFWRRKVSTSVHNEVVIKEQESIEWNEANSIPLFVEKCLIEIEKRGLEEVGIYRISGSSNEIKNLKHICEKDVFSVNLGEIMDINVISGALKLYLREMPEPIMTFALFDSFISSASLSVYDQRLVSLKNILGQLPKCNYYFAKRLVEHLKKVTEFEEVNHMYASNLAIVFGPNLFRAPSEINNGGATAEQDLNVSNSMKHLGKCSSLVKNMILQYEWLFDVGTNNL